MTLFDRLDERELPSWPTWPCRSIPSAGIGQRDRRAGLDHVPPVLSTNDRDVAGNRLTVRGDDGILAVGRERERSVRHLVRVAARPAKSATGSALPFTVEIE